MAIWENACRLLLPGASRRMFAQRLLLQEPVRRLALIVVTLVHVHVRGGHFQEVQYMAWKRLVKYSRASDVK